MSKKLSRREFIKYGVAAGAAMGVAQFPVEFVHAAEFVGNLPRTQSFDVVVVGTGIAGMTAAVTAAENGAKVALLEKQQQALAGGDSALALGTIAIPEADTPEAKDLYYQEFLKKGAGRPDKALTRMLADNVLKEVDWLVGLGAQLMEPKPMPPYRLMGRTAAPGSFRGMPNVLKAMRDAAGKKGVTTFYKTKAKTLLVDRASGRVVGVRTATSDGVTDFRAKAVILATGGYMGDPKMLEQWIGPNADESIVRGAKWLTGEGLHMAEEVGAGAVQMGGLDSIHVAAVSPKNPASGQPSVIIPYALGINKLGKRYIDESLGYVAHGKAVIDQPGAEVAIVFDQALADTPAGKSVIDQFTYFKLDIVKADSIRELAERLGFPADAMIQTVEKFNAAVQGDKALGADPPKAACAVRMEKAPFYALYPLKPGITQTFGGLKINTRCQVLEPDNTPIRGLYAAGEVTGGWFSIDYIGGASLARGLVTGRVAGRLAAQEA
ncbi:MAG: FAD-dependent oxidoreductase [Methanocella sp.]